MVTCSLRIGFSGAPGSGKIMDEERFYTTIDGERVTLQQMVRQEPGWAAARIRLCEDQAQLFEALKRENAELKRALARKSLKSKSS